MTHQTHYCDHGIEVREQDDGVTVSGYAAVFDAQTDTGLGFREVVRPGAFAAALERGDDVRALYNHDPSLVMGRTKAGTLNLTEDGTGLNYRFRPPDTTGARDMLASIRRRDVTGSSFGFRVTDEVWVEGTEDAEPLRELRSVELYDVSPVTYPAYEATNGRLAIRSLEIAREQWGTAAQERTDGMLRKMRMCLDLLRLRV